jgi:hypothetical protein
MKAALAAVLVWTLAAPAWPPWQTLVQGESTHGPTQKAFVAGSVAAARPFAVFLHPEERSRLDRIDFTRDALVAVFRPVTSSGYRVEIRSMRRRRATLTVGVVTHPPTGPVLPVLMTAYQVVAVPRRLLGSPLPRRVVVHDIPR